MLGNDIRDPDGHDGAAGCEPGLGLLDVSTVMTGKKQVTPVEGQCAVTGETVAGYEIHVGETKGSDTERPFSIVRGQPEGARSADNRIQGTYLHGLFESDAFRQAWLSNAGASANTQLNFSAAIDSALDELAIGVSKAVDVEALLKLAATPTLLRQET